MSTDDHNQKKKKRVIRSESYSECVGTNFRLRLNDNLCELGIAYETTVGEEEVLREEGKVILTPRSLKSLSLLLTQAVASFEAKLGEIKMGPKQSEAIAKSVDDAFKKKEAAN